MGVFGWFLGYPSSLKELLDTPHAPGLREREGPWEGGQLEGGWGGEEM